MPWLAKILGTLQFLHPIAQLTFSILEYALQMDPLAGFLVYYAGSASWRR
jgi:hypothetical protein